MSCGGLTVNEIPSSPDYTCSSADFQKVLQEMDFAGYSHVPALPWTDQGVPLRALSDTISSLQSASYPPVFMLMYDQAWILCERLFAVMEVLMGSDVMLDTSIFAWSLHRAEAQSGKKEERSSPGPVSGMNLQ